MCDDAASLVPLVRNAGAVFVGAYAPAVIGDYVGGRQPRAAHRRHGAVRRAPCASPTSASTCTSCRSSRGAASTRAVRDHARRRRRSGRARRRDPPPGAVVSAATGGRVRSRATICGRSRAITRRRSTSHVRLNTNESPYAPPPEFVDRCSTALRDVDWNRYPDRGRGRAAGRARRVPRSAGERFCAPTAATRCCRRCCSPTAAPVAGRWCSSRRTRCTRQIARITATEVVIGERGADFAIDADAAVELAARDTARRSCSCAAPTIRPAPSSRARRSSGSSRPRPRSARCSWSTRPTASSRRGARSSSSTDDRPLVVVRTYSKVWSLAAVRLGFAVAPRWVIAELEKVLLPYTLSVPTQLAGTVALDFRARDAGSASPSLVEERGRCSPALADTPTARRRFRRARTSCSCESRRLRTTLWQRAARSRACSCATSRRWPRVEGCLRVTVGTPAREPMHSSPRSTAC